MFADEIFRAIDYERISGFSNPFSMQSRLEYERYGGIRVQYELGFKVMN